MKGKSITGERDREATEKRLLDTIGYVAKINSMHNPYSEFAILLPKILINTFRELDISSFTVPLPDSFENGYCFFFHLLVKIESTLFINHLKLKVWK